MQAVAVLLFIAECCSRAVGCEHLSNKTLAASLRRQLQLQGNNRLLLGRRTCY
jgi:hypothetical protein